MTRRAHAILLALAVLSSVLAAVVSSAPAGAQLPPKSKVVVKAGYGEADATWHVGAGAGQYSEKYPDQTELAAGGDVDPHGHSTAQRDSYGVHSRLSYRAIVVQDREGDQVAFVKSDSYLAQDHLARRVGQILEAEGSAVSYDEIFHMASHNHSSPYYQTPSWGVFVFQDVFDLRAFEYHARQMAAAILAAEDNLVPARMGATTVTHQIFKGMIARKDIGDDGTPVGYPEDFGDLGLSVLRFDDMTVPSAPSRSRRSSTGASTPRASTTTTSSRVTTSPRSSASSSARRAPRSSSARATSAARRPGPGGPTSSPPASPSGGPTRATRRPSEAPSSCRRTS